MDDQSFNEHQNINTHAITAANMAIKSAQLINGGAAIAVLGFYGKFTPIQLIEISTALVFFAWGVVASALTFALSYLTQYLQAGGIANPSTNLKMTYNILHILALIVLVLSIVCFVLGVYSVRRGMLITGS